MSSQALHILIALSPLLLAPAAGRLGARGRGAGLLALVPAALTVYFIRTGRAVAADGPFTATVPWAPGLDLSLSLHFDGLSLFFAVLVSAIGALVVLYAGAYLHGHPDTGRFHASLFAFMGSMLGLVLSDNLLALFVFWELTGFTSYLLIGFDHDRPDARDAALQALLVTGAGGLALMAAAILVTQGEGTASLSALLASGARLDSHPAYPAIVLLVLAAAFTKSAQFPFHFWLPNAMQAPTPVSAYLHSATMVKAGVYLVARMTPLAGGTALWTGLVTGVAALTMIGASYRAVLETDLKRVLAYSTIGALSVMLLLFGLGSPDAALAGLVYVLAHACYKGALFLVAGAVEHEAGTRDLAVLAGLGRAMPRTAVAGVLAAASMAGVPLFLGFVAKELFYESVLHAAFVGGWRGPLIAVCIGASACLGAAGLMAGVGPFAGRGAPAAGVHEAPVALWLGPLLLAVLGLALGVVPAVAHAPVALAAAAVAPAGRSAPLAPWHGLTLTLLLSAVTLAGSVAIYMGRGTLAAAAWPRALRTERLYAWTLAALDRLSERAAPVMQSASLRFYVLVILLAAVTLVGTGLASARVLPTPRRWTPVEVHEAVIAALVVAAAVSAALARSNMAAVLSLGAVGYGVALLFALFGAPDLAMTQFAVETLTVVIFALVFYRLRGFSERSTSFERARDAVVAATVGVLVTTLVLFIGASGAPSRLAAYFVDAAPRLAHGRNVVNVILVDFRVLDTLGETTVLVTVAIGVRALLLIGREHRR